jgi:hypothetical protein
MSTLVNAATVSGADQNQLADMLKAPQNPQQVKYLLTVANLLGVPRQDAEEIWKRGDLTMAAAESIHRGAQVLNWKPFTEEFHMEPHVHAVAYWMAQHAVNKRMVDVAFEINNLKQLNLELARRVLVLEQK